MDRGIKSGELGRFFSRHYYIYFLGESQKCTHENLIVQPIQKDGYDKGDLDLAILNNLSMNCFAFFL